MRTLNFAAAFLLTINLNAQIDTTKWLRAFPISSYMLDGSDSVKIVQVEMPDLDGAEPVIKEKQIGVLYGTYFTSKADAVEKGYGRCHLIKDRFYYFGITNNKSGKSINPGDLIYTAMEKTNIHYGYFPKLAGHFIELKDVYDSSLYNAYSIFNKWDSNDEALLFKYVINDIKHTGKYFKENNPELNTPVKEGIYKGKLTLDLMIDCSGSNLTDFFNYILARPRIYAGRTWKISEIFATWIMEGSPTVIKE